MKFLNFSALYHLFTLGLILLFHLLHQGRKELVVPSLLLWEDQEENRASKLKWRLKPNLLLFIHLLITTLLVFSLLDPVILGGKSNTNRLVLVIDSSASMQSTELLPNRFHHAINKAITMIQKNSSREIALLVADSEPRVLSDFTLDHQQIIKMLRSLQPSDTAGDPEAVLNLASSLIKNDTSAEIFFFTDGAFSQSQNWVESAFKIIQIGNPTDNLGITELKTASSGRAGEYQIMVKIENFSPAIHTVPLKINNPEGLIIRDTLTFEPWEEKTLTYNLFTSQRLPYRLILETNDALAIDDYADFILGPVNLRVLLVGPGNFFLERGLRCLPHLELFTRATITPQEAGRFDLVIFDRFTPPYGMEGNLVLINTSLPEWEIKPTNNVLSKAEFSWWKTSHPLFRFVDLSAIKVKECSTLIPSEIESETLVSSSKGALVTMIENPTSRILVFHFDLEQSNLPIQIGFPIMLSNLVSWYYPEYSDPEICHNKTGKVLTIAAGPRKQPIKALLPDGKKEEFLKGLENYAISNTKQRGIYQIFMEDGSSDYYAINLLSSNESNLTPRSFTTPNTLSNSNIQNISLWYKELWPLLNLIILLLLIIEYYLYHRPARFIWGRNKQ